MRFKQLTCVTSMTLFAPIMPLRLGLTTVKAGTNNIVPNPRVFLQPDRFFPSCFIFSRCICTGATSTLTNTGNMPLRISKIEAQAPYSESDTCGAMVGPGNSCEISATFKPRTTGEFDRSVLIFDNTDGPQKISLFGNASCVPLAVH